MSRKGFGSDLPRKNANKSSRQDPVVIEPGMIEALGEIVISPNANNYLDRHGIQFRSVISTLKKFELVLRQAPDDFGIVAMKSAINVNKPSDSIVCCQIPGTRETWVITSREFDGIFEDEPNAKR